MPLVYILIFLAVVEATHQSTCIGPAASQCEVSLLQTDLRLQLINGGPDAPSEASPTADASLKTSRAMHASSWMQIPTWMRIPTWTQVLQTTEVRPDTLSEAAPSRRESVTTPASVVAVASTVRLREGLGTWNELHHRATSYSAETAVIVLVMLILIGVVFIVMMLVLSRHDDKESYAQDLLNNSLQASSAQESRLHLAAAAFCQDPQPRPTVEVSAGWAKLRNLVKTGFLGRGDSVKSPPAFTPGPRALQGPMHLMPEMVVQEKGGAQFVIDGFISTTEQQGSHLEVWRISPDLGDRKVMRFGFCEGTSHQKGITVELPDSTPVALVNTNFAFSKPTGHQAGAFSSNRHVTIFDAVSGLDLSTPFAKVEREANGTQSTVRRMSGEVICIVQSGGYNTDFGNIVDYNHKLIATVSNRGHGMTGLGRLAMERGDWTDNRRVVQIAQGVDAMLVVCAIIGATKLDPGSACTS